MNDTDAGWRDFCQRGPSPLVRRLLRRYSEPLGIIDVHQSQRQYARMIGWCRQRHPLLAHLMQRCAASDVDAAQSSDLPYRGFSGPVVAVGLSGMDPNVGTCTSPGSAKPAVAISRRSNEATPDRPIPREHKGSQAQSAPSSESSMGSDPEPSSNPSVSLDSPTVLRDNRRPLNAIVNPERGALAHPLRDRSASTARRVRRVSVPLPPAAPGGDSPLFEWAAEGTQRSAHLVAFLDDLPVESDRRIDPRSLIVTSDSAEEGRNHPADSLSTGVSPQESEASPPNQSALAAGPSGSAATRSALHPWKMGVATSPLPVVENAGAPRTLAGPLPLMLSPVPALPDGIAERLARAEGAAVAISRLGAVRSARRPGRLFAPSSVTESPATRTASAQRETPLVWHAGTAQEAGRRDRLEQPPSLSAGADVRAQPALNRPFEQTVPTGVGQVHSDGSGLRLSRREWSQLVERLSRMIWNKIALDLDRRGIRTWR